MATERNNPMKCDVREMKDSYLLEIELPGCRKDDMKVYIENGALTIEATRNKDKKEGKRKFIREECYRGDTKRSFELGDDIDAEKIQADYKDGILSLQLPKLTAKKTSRTDISIH